VRKPTGLTQKIAILKHVPFFQGVSRSALRKICERLFENEFRKGQYLYWEGDPSDRLYLVSQGRVKITKCSSSGREMVLEIVTSGEICGGNAIFSHTQLASAQAIEHVSAFSLSKKDILQLLSSQNKLAIHFIMYLGEKLMQTHQMMLSLATSKVDKRIAALLMGLCEKHGSKVSRGIRIDLRLTRQDVADIVGTTVETTIRVISRFRKQGILITDAKHIIITDREKLRGVVSG
jgi:CRP/FNR family cyclic AMP-dependent transcriptional regulator